MADPRDSLDAPTVLVVDDEAISRDLAAHILRAAGWRVVTAADGPTALAAAATRPDLILMDLCMDGMCGFETTAAIRSLGGSRGAMPILAYTTLAMDDPGALLADGFDGYVRKPCDPDHLAACAAEWGPADTATLRRLGAAFGSAQIDGMTTRFAALLTEALAALDRGDAISIAHRVAGIAGTLGFTEAGTAWLKLSEGHAQMAPDARRHSRRALAALAHPSSPRKVSQDTSN